MFKNSKTKMLVDIDWYAIQKIDTISPDIKKFSEII